MAALVADIRLTDRRSFPEWYAELKINSTFRNVWYLVDPEAPNAPHLLSAEPPLPLTIDQMIEQSNVERNTPLAIWDADNRPEAEKGARPVAPRPARFDDIKEEYSFRLKEYSIRQSTWAAQSSRYQNIWDWVRRTVEPALLAPHLELLVSQQNLSLQNVVRALRDKFQPSEDNTREQVREDYRKVLELGRIGSVAPSVWINDWYKALARAQTYRVAEVNGFLATKDFLQVVESKLMPVWGAQQLALAIEANALGEPVRTLEQYGKIFEALIQQNERSANAIFATLGSRSDGYSCPCKETRAEKHPWHPKDCSIIELAIMGSTTRKLDPLPTEEQLKAVRERLATRAYDKLREQLEKKGWVKKEKVQYPGNISC
jgi:hypothetical protein